MGRFEPRLIDAEILKLKINNRLDILCDDCGVDEETECPYNCMRPDKWMDDIKKIIDEFPVENGEIRPEFHAHWIERKSTNDLFDRVQTCSRCAMPSYSIVLDAPYCAFCGAKMDEEKEVKS